MTVILPKSLFGVEQIIKAGTTLCCRLIDRPQAPINIIDPHEDFHLRRAKKVRKRIDLGWFVVASL
tara:strand:- start:33 stop:230 length:198 start_codon:yes stop_codon:yes gene_type:complete